MMSNRIKLLEADKNPVVVVGGGPAGSFFAIHLLREAKLQNRDIKVVIIEKKGALRGQDVNRVYQGCNFGAGGISPTLNERLAQDGIQIPHEINQGDIKRIWIHGMWKNIPLKVPEGMKMSSVFRGTLPPKLRHDQIGFDTFLLAKAEEDGAEILAGEVQEMKYSESGLPLLVTRMASGEELTIQASFVAASIGVNVARDKNYRDSMIIRSIQRINRDFIPAKLRNTIVFELEVGRDYLHKNLDGEIYFIEYGTKTLPLEHVALIPKGNYLTVAVIGGFVDKASHPRDTLRLIKSILELPQLEKIIPDIAAFPVACSCSPMITVGVAKNPYADRLALLGDIVGSRLYKDGLYSAYLMASSLAKVVLREGIDKRTLGRSYGKTVKWLSLDNRFGKQVFCMIRFTFRSALLSRIFYQTFATEMKIKDASKRPLGEVLWKIASGSSDYKQIFKDMFSFRVLRSALVGGMLMTLRNIFIEFLFGLKWGEYGRYPTVILKEKRDYIKGSISLTSGMALDKSPDFERMYAIKIKASRERIFEELGKFGDDQRSYLWLRFIKIKRISGVPNKSKSVIRYKLKFPPLELDMQLKRVIPARILFYEVSERFVDKGKLIFETKPTEDGNSRLVIYTAFSFKKGRNMGSKIFWRLSRLIFPAFIHDIVWNHALCSIKEKSEGGVV